MGELEREGEDRMEDQPEPTLGERLTRGGRIPPGESQLIDDIRAKVAELIDICDGLKHDDPEHAAKAIEHLELAEMYAEKAAS